jgi:hypothetical protein
MNLKAITIHQPWAYAILHLGKNVENRGWFWGQGIGGELAIHAGKTYDWEGEGFINSLNHTVPGNPPMGALVGIVTLTGAHHAMRCTRNALPRNTYCSPWAVGLQYHWELSHPQAIEPIPCRGMQGVWDVPDDAAAILRAAREARTAR